MQEREQEPSPSSAETWDRGESPGLVCQGPGVAPVSPSMPRAVAPAQGNSVRVVRNMTDARGESASSTHASGASDSDQPAHPSCNPDAATRARGESVRDGQVATRRRGESTN